MYDTPVTALVRDAVVGDADAMGLIAVRSWKATYRGLIADSLLDALSERERADQFRGAIGTVRPRRVTLVVEVADAVAGYAAFGPAREGSLAGLRPPFGDVGELYLIYLDPEHVGRGLGRVLHDGAVARARESGFVAAVVWVHPDNVRARRFYEAAGWTLEGTERTEDFSGHAIPEIRYHRTL